jgi:tetratricopeptide (TPR) repeat protein
MNMASGVLDEPDVVDSLPATDSAGTAAWIYAVLLVVAAVMFAVGVFLALNKQGWAILAAGCVSIVVVLTAWPIAKAMSDTVSAQRRRQMDIATMLSERLQQISVLLNVISEQQLLSDRAKQVAFRDKDRDALRRAIKEDLARRDWEAALVLVTDMEQTFGYRQEAVQFREEINNHRQEVVGRQIAEATQRIDNYCRMEKWTEAVREADRLMQLYPGEANVAQLPQEIETRRQGTKKQLLDAFNEAVARKDVDGGIEIIKKLDMYLTKQEADSMQEAVRNIFKEKLNQLGTQFTLSVQDQKWHEALRTGEIIIREFPNSGIAREVRERLPFLHQKAGETQEVAKV